MRHFGLLYFKHFVCLVLFVRTYVRTYVLAFDRSIVRLYVRTYVCLFVCLFVCVFVCLLFATYPLLIVQGRVRVRIAVWVHHGATFGVGTLARACARAGARTAVAVFGQEQV